MDRSVQQEAVSFRSPTDAITFVSASKPALDRPVLFVVVDTETEFDWSKPFSRDSTAVTHADALDRFQDLCAEFQLRPLYLMDYAVATAPAAVAKLRNYQDAGAAFVGAHLHTW